MKTYTGSLTPPGAVEVPWGRNFIDHRHSRVMVDERGCPGCSGCGCELDRGDSVHHPRCTA